MQIIPLLLKEFEQEATITQKMLERVPDDQFSYKPHEKSMNMMQLTTHIAELSGWIAMGMTTSGLDFAQIPYEPKIVSSTKELLELFKNSVQAGKAALEKATEEELLPSWTLRHGETIFMTLSKYELIRHSLSQTIHHRAQLGVYLRLLNIALPKTYGPSADEPSF
ncbi:MAG: DinB family protein [Chitinophagaceae bacterium]|nr:DinB family protein [Chitinophagaceae bacterium]